MVQNKQIFITGGAGSIGSTLVGRLVEHNRIVVYDNLSRDALLFETMQENQQTEVLHKVLPAITDGC